MLRNILAAFRAKKKETSLAVTEQEILNETTTEWGQP